jgi:hypothetical protein
MEKNLEIAGDKGNSNEKAVKRWMEADRGRSEEERAEKGCFWGEGREMEKKLFLEGVFVIVILLKKTGRGQKKYETRLLKNYRTLNKIKN